MKTVKIITNGSDVQEITTIVNIKTIKTVINYDRSIEELVEAGKYDESEIPSKVWCCERGVGENKKQQGKEGIEFRLFSRDDRCGLSFNDCTTDVMKCMELDGFRPATLKELLVYGEKNPDDQRVTPIIGFGTYYTDSDNTRRFMFPQLDGINERSVRLCERSYSGGLNTSSRYLGVKTTEISGNNH